MEPGKEDKATVPLGDVLQKLAMHSYEEMRVLLEALPQQTALIRAEKLDELLQHAKRRFTQVYSLLSWLQADHVRSYLKSTVALQNDVTQETVRLNTKLDTLYYMQAGDQTQFIAPLNAKRIRPIDAVIAAEILSAGTYPFLPTSIFDLSQAPLSTVTPSTTPLTSPTMAPLDCKEKKALAQQLELTIRSKIFTGDSIPTCFQQVSFDSSSGMLLLTSPDCFQVTLSLSELDTAAAWEVIHFRLLIKPHDEEQLDIEFALEELEKNVFLVLKQVVAAQSSNTDSTTATTTAVQQEDAIKNISPLSSSSTFLSTLHLICQHSALSVTLRFLYIQALATIRTSFPTSADAFFHETNTFQICTLRFWRSRLNRNHSSRGHTGRGGSGRHHGRVSADGQESGQAKGLGGKRKIHQIGMDEEESSGGKQYEYEVIIYISRTPGGMLKALLRPHDASNDKNDRNPFSIELDLLDTSLSSVVHTDTDSHADSSAKVISSSKIAISELYISNCLKKGVHFSRLMNDVIQQCAVQRLKFLMSVVRASPAGMGAMKQGICVTLCTDTVHLTLSMPGYCDVAIQVDSRSGLYVVSASLVSPVLSDRVNGLCSKFQKDLLALLQVERNNQPRAQQQQQKQSLTPASTAIDEHSAMDIKGLDSFIPLATLSPYADILVSLGPLCSIMILSKWVQDITSLEYNLKAGGGANFAATMLGTPNTNSHWYQHFFNSSEAASNKPPHDIYPGSIDSLNGLGRIGRDDDSMSVVSRATSAAEGGATGIISPVQGVLFPLHTWTDRLESKEESCFDAQLTSFLGLSVEGEETDYALVADFFLVFSPLDPTSPTIPALRLPTVLFQNTLKTLSSASVMVDPVQAMLDRSKPQASTCSPSSGVQMSPDELRRMLEQWIYAATHITLDIQLRLASLLPVPSPSPFLSSRSSLQFLPFDHLNKRWAFTLSSADIEDIAMHALHLKTKVDKASSPATLAVEHMFVYCSTSFCFKCVSGAGDANGATLGTRNTELNDMHGSRASESSIIAMVNTSTGQLSVLITPSACSLATVADMKQYFSSIEAEGTAITIPVSLSMPPTSQNTTSISLTLDEHQAVIIRAQSSHSSIDTRTHTAPPTSLCSVMKLTHVVAAYLQHIFSFIRSTSTPLSLPTQLIPRSIYESFMEVSSRDFGVEIWYPPPLPAASPSSGAHQNRLAPGGVMFKVKLAVQSLLGSSSSSSSSSMITPLVSTAIQDISVWNDFLSVKMTEEIVSVGDAVEEVMPSVLSKCLLECFQLKVNAGFIAHCEASGPISAAAASTTKFISTYPTCNWFGLIENAAIDMLPLVLLARSIRECLHHRNLLFLSCLTPMSSEHARNEANRQCEKVICVKTRLFSVNKVSFLFRVTKKMKSSVHTDALLSPQRKGTSAIDTSPAMTTRDVQLDIELGSAPSSPQPLQIVKLGSTVFSLEHVSIDTVKSDAVVRRVLDNFVSGLFQQ